MRVTLDPCRRGMIFEVLLIALLTAAGTLHVLADGLVTARLAEQRRLAHDAGLRLDNDAFRATRHDVADGDNAALVLLAALERVEAVPDDGVIYRTDVLRHLPSPGSLELLRERVAAAEEALTLLMSRSPAWASPVQARWPLPDDFSHFAPSHPLPLDGIRVVARLVSDAAIVAASDGDWMTWAAYVQRLMDLGDAVAALGDVQTFLIAAGCHALAAEHVQFLGQRVTVGDDGLTPDALRRLADRLARQDALAAQFDDVTRNKHLQDRDLVLRFYGDIFTNIDGEPRHVLTLPAALQVRWAAGILRDHEEAGVLAEHRLIREAFAKVTSDDAAVLERVEAFDDPAAGSAWQRFRRSLHPVGYAFRASYGTVTTSAVSRRVEGELAAVVLGVRLYRHEHGGLPETLDALVPDLLTAVPPDRDAGDGRPIRYDRDGGIIWSVGSNGHDNGGFWEVPPGATLRTIRETTDRVWSVVPRPGDDLARMWETRWH